jgi:hypothetical protein
MGLILDSSVAIAAERRHLPVEDMLSAIRELTGPEEIALSVVRVMELEHGIWRAKSRPKPPGASSSWRISSTTFPSILSPRSWRAKRAVSMPSSRPEASGSLSRIC